MIGRVRNRRDGRLASTLQNRSVPVPPTWGGLGWAVLGTSMAFLSAGILAPGTAEVLLRTYIVLLAAGFLASRSYQSGLPSRKSNDIYSPFTDERATHSPPETPPEIRRLAVELQGLDNPTQAEREVIPLELKRAVIAELSHRLSERHGLDLTDPNHHTAIQQIVSSTTWRLVRPGRATGMRGGTESSQPPIPIARLSSIFDELEKL
jgi:hypothetical protein